MEGIILHTDILIMYLANSTLHPLSLIANRAKNLLSVLHIKTTLYLLHSPVV